MDFNAHRMLFWMGLAVQPLRRKIIFLSLSFTKLDLVYDMVKG